MEMDFTGRARGLEEINYASPLGQSSVYDIVSSNKVLILKDKEWLVRQNVQEKTNTSQGTARVKARGCLEKGLI